jgi:cytoskeleton protein RodZ
VTAIDAQSSDDAAIAPGFGPGARLRAAREAAGLSLDQVAQQLKLAPRQVKALEDENFAELPGRTFSRGFMRNYARLLSLDPDLLLQDLPDVALAPALGSPALHSTGAMIGELPSNHPRKRSGFARWLIPLLLIGCIVGAAAYEWYRGTPTATIGDVPRPAKTSTSAELRVEAPTGTPLPNPLAGEVAPATSAPANDTAVNEDPKPAAVVATSPSLQASSPGDAPLLISYAGPSWTEIRDRSGQLVVSRLVPANSVEPVPGNPPFDIVLGNALAVTLSYHGKNVDLAPYTRKNIARLTLQ